jgi:hypothetical protein
MGIGIDIGAAATATPPRRTVSVTSLVSTISSERLWSATI